MLDWLDDRLDALGVIDAGAVVPEWVKWSGIVLLILLVAGGDM